MGDSDADARAEWERARAAAQRPVPPAAPVADEAAEPDGLDRLFAAFDEDTSQASAHAPTTSAPRFAAPPQAAPPAAPVAAPAPTGAHRMPQPPQPDAPPQPTTMSPGEPRTPPTVLPATAALPQSNPSPRPTTQPPAGPTPPTAAPTHAPPGYGTATPAAAAPPPAASLPPAVAPPPAASPPPAVIPPTAAAPVAPSSAPSAAQAPSAAPVRAETPTVSSAAPATHLPAAPNAPSAPSAPPARIPDPAPLGAPSLMGASTASAAPPIQQTPIQQTPIQQTPPPQASQPATPTPPPRRAPDGPFRFALEPSVPIDDGRSTLGEKIAFGASILVPPIGLIADIVMAIRSRARRGWTHGLTSAGIVVSLVMLALLAVAGGIADRGAADAIEHRQLESDSVAFCSEVGSLPLQVRSADFGWPAVAGTISESLSSMQLFVERWDSLAAVSPQGVRADAAAVAAAGRAIIATDGGSRVIHDQQNRDQMTALRAGSSVPGWIRSYCSP